MKINFDQNILDSDGKPWPMTGGPEWFVSEIEKLMQTTQAPAISKEVIAKLAREPKQYMKLRDVALQALTNSQQDATPVQRYNCFQLIQKINSSKKETDLQVEDIAVVKEAIGKYWAHPVIMGRSWDLLEGK